MSGAPTRTGAATARLAALRRSENRWVSKHIINESATQNEEGERVGPLGLFGLLVRRFKPAVFKST
jgi:hypothetical protein